MTDWIEHKGTEPPELAPAALVIVQVEYPAWVFRVDEVFWKPGLEYRKPRDEDGIPYISADGLDHRLVYAVTQPDGAAWGLSSKPYVLTDHFGGDMLWSKGDDQLKTMARNLEDAHRHPGDWRESLYRVRRDE